MSELMIRGQGNTDARRFQLLMSVSIAAIMVASGMSFGASADEADHPTFWIELGGQLEQIAGGHQTFTPPFALDIPSTFFSPISFQKPLKNSFGGTGALSFEPEGTDWVFSAGVQFGRSNGTRHTHQQTANAAVPVHSKIPGPPPVPTLYPGKYVVNAGYDFYPKGHVKFEDAQSQQSETHLVLDFQAGKDVGLGLFGGRGSSVISAGVRFAQFTSKANVSLRIEPDVHYPTAPITNFAQLRGFKYYDPIHFHDYAASENSQRSFHGIGPSLAWNGSTPLFGSSEQGVSLDWGANAAVLFGRQKVRGHHQSTTRSYYGNHFQKKGVSRHGYESGYFVYASLEGYVPPYTHQARNSRDFSRSRTVVVPNLGGTAGLSFRYLNAKVSFGYRADFFFGAMDEGIDTRRTENVGFHGPYAAISVGFP
jgi:hypothetical protein